MKKVGSGGKTRRGREGREFVRTIQRALRRESWGRNILQLAWTAGPVTYLALQGGYMLGYGESAPGSLFIYFAAYTIIAGAVAILVRIIYQVTQGREIERGSRILRDCLDQLPRLLLVARDEALRGYNESDARLLTAKHLLANPDASELAVAAAISDLGGSRDLAYAFQRIEVLRRNGMPSRVEAERERIEEEVQRLCADLQERSPDTALLVAERSHGRAPSKRRGRARTEGFLERTIAAESEDDERLMSLADVEEVLSLAIELLAGRSMPVIGFELSGDRSAREAWIAIERARRDFRATLRSRNSRLRIVAERLSQRLPDVVPSIARIGNAAQLRDEVVAALDEWARELGRPRIRKPSRSDVEAFRRAVAAYRMLEQSAASLRRRHAALLSTYDRYEAAIASRASREPLDLSMDDADGVRITESEIGLDERDRITLARSIRRVLANAGVWDVEAASLDAGSIRGLAIAILAAVEKQIPIYRPEVQQAIELARAPTVESLEPGLSTDVRTGWVTALVSDVQPNTAEYVLRRIEQLARFHAIRLGPKTKERLAEEYGIAVDSLAAIDRNQIGTSRPWTRPPMEIPPRADNLRKLAESIAKR